MDFAFGADDLLAADGQVARTAPDQASQQPGFDVFGEVPGTPFRVVPAHFLGGFEGGVIDHRGAGDGDPVFSRPAPLGPGVPAVAQGGHGLGLVEVHPSDVCLIGEDPAHRGVPPLGFAGRGGDVVGVEAAHDLTDGVPAAEVVVVDPAHDSCFGLEDFEAGGTRAVAGDPPIPIGCFPGHHLSGPGPVEPAPPVPFPNFRFLVLGDHALHLGEETELGVVVIYGRGVGEDDPHPELGELVKHEDLVHVGTGETVGRQAPHRLERPGFGLIAHRVEPGPAVLRRSRRRRTRRPAHVLPRRYEPGGPRAGSRSCRVPVGTRWTPGHTTRPSSPPCPDGRRDHGLVDQVVDGDWLIAVRTQSPQPDPGRERPTGVASLLA